MKNKLIIFDLDGTLLDTAKEFHIALNEVLKKEGFDVRLAGNIGNPVLKLKKGHKKTIYIIEISSFQLEIKSYLKPEIAVLLNISEDHLDRHASMTEYRDIKSNIFKNQNETNNETKLLNYIDIIKTTN